jgi:hypothetical protein
MLAKKQGYIWCGAKSGVGRNSETRSDMEKRGFDATARKHVQMVEWDTESN